MPMNARLVLVLALAALAPACGGESSAETATDTADGAPDGAPEDGGVPPKVLSISFDRVLGSRDFDAIVEVSIDPGDTSGTSVAISCDRGFAGQVAAAGQGASGPRFAARIAAGGTGRHVVTARLEGEAISATRTALVMPEVDDAWNQPEPVTGLVDTPGWEDGPDISPDGRWLVIQYLPVPIDCIMGMDPEAEVCSKAVGPVGAPERPNMPGAERVAQDGTITHGCPSLGVPQMPFPVPPNSLWAFRRAGDGPGSFDFEDPHPIFYDGADGCVSAFGLSLLGTAADGATDAVWAFDSPLDSADDSGGDLFAAHFALGGDVVLGRFESNAGVVTLAEHLGAAVGDPAEGAQGNPWAWQRPGGGYAVFYDDESVRQELFVVQTDGALGGGAWGAPAQLPDPISVAGRQESQPFFDGETLYFRRDLTVYASAWNGGPFGDAASWSEPVAALGEDPTAAEPGAILGAGEPTIFASAQGRELYFVFVQRSGGGTLDLDIGVVPSRPGT
jgi:hypothetical protein